jgi:DNA-directed RNA polymerase subunit F
MTLSWSFTNQAEASKVLTPVQQQRVANTLEHDAEVMSNTQLEAQLAGKPRAVQEEIISINTDARHIALQIALIVPLLAALIGFGNAFRMMRLADPKPSEAVEGLALG